MNFIDLLPDDVIENINHQLQKLDINEKRRERQKKRKIQKQQKPIDKHYKICQQLSEKAHKKYKNISNIKYYIGGFAPYQSKFY